MSNVFLRAFIQVSILIGASWAALQSFSVSGKFLFQFCTIDEARSSIPNDLIYCKQSTLFMIIAGIIGIVIFGICIFYGQKLKKKIAANR